MDRREYVCNQMYKQHDLLRKGSWTDADKLEYMELNIAPYSRYWRMGMKKALKHAIRLLREEEENADRKTENSSEKPNNCEHITEDGVTCAKYPACDDCLDNPLNKVKGSERLVKGSEKPNSCEPKICDTCRYYNSNIPCGSTPSACKEADKFAEEFVDGLKKLKPKDEPQTDCGDFANRLAYERGVKHAWEVAQKVFDSTVTFYEAEDVAKQITKGEPQTNKVVEKKPTPIRDYMINGKVKDEPQTDCP